MTILAMGMLPDLEHLVTVTTPIALIKAKKFPVPICTETQLGAAKLAIIERASITRVTLKSNHLNIPNANTLKIGVADCLTGIYTFSQHQINRYWNKQQNTIPRHRFC